MSAPLPHASSIEAERAIGHVEAVLRAAKNSNQHGENMIALMDKATAMFQALSAIHDEAPFREPSDAATVALGPNYSQELREYVDEIIRKAFEEGAARGRWEAAEISRAALGLSVGAA